MHFAVWEVPDVLAQNGGLSSPPSQAACSACMAWITSSADMFSDSIQRPVWSLEPQVQSAEKAIACFEGLLSVVVVAKYRNWNRHVVSVRRNLLRGSRRREH